MELTDSEPHFLVFGDSGSGKSSFLRTWMKGLVARRSAWEARFVVVDYRRSLLGVLPTMTHPVFNIVIAVVNPTPPGHCGKLRGTDANNVVFRVAGL